MSEYITLKILTLLLITALLLTLFGTNKAYSILRWEVLGVMVVLVITALSSGRYYWASIFAFFGFVFNPLYPISMSKEEWVICDIILICILAYWFWDYFTKYHKGLLFERYVQGTFSQAEWIIVDYTRDSHKRLGRFVESDANPDFKFRKKATGKTLAIECKYRSEYTNSRNWGFGIQWNTKQGERYLNYGRKNNIPVYIAIGVGGNPKSPKTLSYIPIEVIQKRYFHFIPKKIIEENQNLPTV